MLRSLVLKIVPFAELGCNIQGRLLAPSGALQLVAQQQHNQLSTAADRSSSVDSSTSTSAHQQQESAAAQQVEQQQLQQQSGQQQIESSQPPKVPVLPTHMILKTIRESERPLNSHELYQTLQQQYSAVFPSRHQFKKHLHHLSKLRWVDTKPPKQAAATQQASSPAAAAAPPKKKGSKKSKETREHYVYSATAAGRRVDVFATGSPLQKAARAVANKWTAKHLPSYAKHLAAGKLPITADNIGMLEPKQARQLLFQQVQQQQQGRPK